jgi:uroporphyrinogen decarboxylase
MLDDPDFVQEMCDFWADFIAATLAPICERVQLDSVTISEDMAFKLHSMISPTMARRFLLPAYQRWSELLRASGCRVIMMDCDGYVADLIPIWIDGGITCAWPIEVAAENDILEYRRRFGSRMAYQGGMDKRAIARGGDAMRDMVTRIVPPLLETGGFIPRCDHAVPTGVSWPNFLEYARLIARLTGWL